MTESPWGASDESSMNLERYSRQVILPEIGIQGQQTLLDSRVLIVGVGGLGCAAAQYLAAGGIGHLTLADGDHVELSNLQRQILHSEDSVGMNKAESARQRLQVLNSTTQIETITEFLDDDGLESVFDNHDLIIDASDNFETRHAINLACIKRGKPLVSGAAIRQEGQVMLLAPGQPDSACYHCVFPSTGETQERCEDTGVLGPVVGLVGSYQALLAMQWLTGIAPSIGQKLLVIDAASGRVKTLSIHRDPDCPACRQTVK